MKGIRGMKNIIKTPDKANPSRVGGGERRVFRKMTELPKD
jgi:hypothetical protein